MKKLPRSDVYEKEFEFMPWGELIKKVLGMVQKEVPRGGAILDLMSGPGYLLGEIGKVRADLALKGVDIDKGFIKHAKAKYPNVSFEVADVLDWKTDEKFDLVLCTGSFHHLAYDKQKDFIETIPSLLKQGGFAILADSYIDDYSTEEERKQYAAKLGYEYIIATMKNGATNDVVKATIDILHNDVLGFEYKTSLRKIEPVFRKVFQNIDIIKIWPKEKSDYGDYIVVCRKN